MGSLRSRQSKVFSATNQRPSQAYGRFVDVDIHVIRDEQKLRTKSAIDWRKQRSTYAWAAFSEVIEGGLKDGLVFAADEGEGQCPYEEKGHNDPDSNNEFRAQRDDASSGRPELLCSLQRQLELLQVLETLEFARRLFGHGLGCLDAVYRGSSTSERSRREGPEEVCRRQKGVTGRHG